MKMNFIIKILAPVQGYLVLETSESKLLVLLKNAQRISS